MPPFSSLDHTALRLDEQAQELRRQAGQLAAASASAWWRSPAATMFRRRTDTTCQSLRTCAADIERAADELRDHARHARAIAHLVTATEQAAARTVEHAAEDTAHAAHTGISTMRHVASGLLDLMS